MTLNNISREIIKKFYILILASTIDAYFTYTGVIAGRIKEANPLLKNVVNNFYLMFSIKVLLPLMAVLFILRLMKRTNMHFSKFTILLVNVVIFIYIIVLVLHIYYIVITQ